VSRSPERSVGESEAICFWIASGSALAITTSSEGYPMIGKQEGSKQPANQGTKERNMHQCKHIRRLPVKKAPGERGKSLRKHAENREYGFLMVDEGFAECIEEYA
jgi:hypothetical protein